jgi:acylphosphatase
MSDIAKHILVHGRVQGVGFRYFAQRVGTRLGCKGNVRNLPDCDVEIFVEGEAQSVATFLKEMAMGPAVARVDRIDVLDIEPTGNYGAFLIEGR